MANVAPQVIYRLARKRAPPRSSATGVLGRLGKALAARANGKCLLCGGVNARGEVGIGPAYVKVCEGCMERTSRLIAGAGKIVAFQRFLTGLMGGGGGK